MEHRSAWGSRGPHLQVGHALARLLLGGAGARLGAALRAGRGGGGALCLGQRRPQALSLGAARGRPLLGLGHELGVLHLRRARRVIERESKSSAVPCSSPAETAVLGQQRQLCLLATS